MVRYLRIALLVILGIVLVILALANRAPVDLRLLPADASAYFGLDWTIRLPLFLVILGGVLAGIAVGFIWEWVRESKHRSAVTRHRREAARLGREVSRLRDARQEPEDEVLALLETNGRSR